MRTVIGVVVAVAALAVPSPALAHQGDRAKPRIAASLSDESGLDQTLSVRLRDADSPEPVTTATVSATALMTSPHVMRTTPWRLAALGGGLYRTRLRFPMAARWEVEIAVSGEDVVGATAQLAAVVRREAAVETPNEASAAAPQSLETRLEDDLTRRDYFSMAMLWLHSLSALGWIIGVVVMAIALGGRPPLLAPAAHARVAHAYREWGAWLHWGFVPVIVLTGIYNMLRVTPFPLVWRPSELERLAEIPYGAIYEAILAVKLGLFLSLLVTGWAVLMRTTRSRADAASSGGFVSSLWSALGPPGIAYLAAIPLILAAAMALRYVHVLSHVGEVISGSGA